MDIRSSAEESRNPLEKLLLKIPGFKGYLEKEFRRETDHLLRQQLVSRLGEGKLRYLEAVREITDLGRLALLKPATEISNLLNKVESRIKYASHGYSGFFDAAKIDEAALDRLYAFDLALTTEVDALAAGLAALKTGLEDEAGIRQKLSSLRETLRALDTRLNERDQAARLAAGG